MPEFKDISPNRIFLYLENPRHDSVEDETQAIEYLCKNEDVFPLAQDIAKWGLNPLELFALVAIKNNGKGNQSYIVHEGNRRICAIKLLNDPDLAPANLRKKIVKLTQTWTPIATVSAAIFTDTKKVKHWMERIHNGAQGGIGRKQWNADQKTRFSGDNKNKIALALLDYAHAEGMISAEERKDKLTTAQRFLNNAAFREALGIDQSNFDDIARTRPQIDFDVLLKKFMRDLVGGKDVTSRMNKKQIVEYAHNIVEISGTPAHRIKAQPLSLGVSRIKHKPTAKPRKKTLQPLEKVLKVNYENDIFTALKELDNRKLLSLYHSICNIDLEFHTPITSIGVWAFFETLTACIGRNDTTSFDSFLSSQKLKSYGFQSDNIKSMNQALQRTSSYGNTTKHHKIAANFNGDQLNNDMATLKELILKCIEEAITNL